MKFLWIDVHQKIISLHESEKFELNIEKHTSSSSPSESFYVEKPAKKSKSTYFRKTDQLAFFVDHLHQTLRRLKYEQFEQYQSGQ